jgi:hypothetical protein
MTLITPLSSDSTARADDPDDMLTSLMMGGTAMPTPSEYWQDTIVVTDLNTDFNPFTAFIDLEAPLGAGIPKPVGNHRDTAGPARPSPRTRRNLRRIVH